jgi:phospholipase/carboxylesterase
LINLLVTERVADAQQIFLLGFSQSCALNYRFAFTHPEKLSGVIGICGGVPGDWDTSTRYQPTQARVFHLAGEQDEFYPPKRVADYAAQLGTLANSVEFKSYAAGHEIVPEMRQDIRAWLQR